MLGAELPVRTAPQQMMVTEALEPVVPLLLAAAGRHLTLKQLSNGNVIIGGGWPGAFDYERDRALVRRDSVAGNLWVASRVIPALAGVRLLRSWSTVGVMTDGAPIVGEYPGIPGFFNAVGANGYTMGPILGRISAGMILGEEAPLDLAPFLVDRFG
jgi:glycine/D-amino acid oxidase-like deaminating enzyme